MERTGTLLRCIDCGVASDELATGWRAYIAPVFYEDEPETEVLLFCPECAKCEFGPLGRDERP